MTQAYITTAFDENQQRNICCVKELALVEQFLTRYHKNETNPCLKSTIKKILNHSGMIHISDMASPMGCCSQRQIERQFKIHVGVSPKKFAEIIQFKYSLHLLENNNLSFSEIALEAGYYDQAHFIKSFKKFTKVTPKYFLALSA